MRKEILALILVMAIAFLGLGGYLLYNNWQISIMKIPPRAPSELLATPVSAVQVELTWKDNSNNEIGFLVYRDGVKIDDLPAKSKSYIDSGRRPATSYRYEIIAYNLAGQSTVALCSVRTLNPPIQVWLEKIGVHENGEEGESFRELWDILRSKDLTGEVQIGFIVTDGKQVEQISIPEKGYFEFRENEVQNLSKLLFTSGEVGDCIRIFATAYEQDGGFAEEVIYKVLDFATGSAFGTPTSILLTLSGVDFSGIFADIAGADDDWLGSYVAEWTIDDNWGTGNYVDIECKRDNGNVGLRLWFSIECTVYNYSLDPPQ